jgi:hypothetical protein
MKNKKILALDLGTKTGWAIKLENNQINSGTIEFKPSRFEGGGMRYLRFKKWLDEINQLTNGINRVYFEEVRRHIGVDAAHAYGGFLAYLTSWCEEEKIPYLAVVGDKEIEENKVAIRGRAELDLGAISVEEFANRLKEEITNKKI